MEPRWRLAWAVGVWLVGRALDEAAMKAEPVFKWCLGTMLVVAALMLAAMICGLVFMLAAMICGLVLPDLLPTLLPITNTIALVMIWTAVAECRWPARSSAAGWRLSVTG